MSEAPAASGRPVETASPAQAQSCPNCGARLEAGRCLQCRAVVPGRGPHRGGSVLAGAANAPPGDRRDVDGGSAKPSAGSDAAGSNGPAELVSRAEALARIVDAAQVARVFAMPLTSTRPQSVGHGTSWWVCVSVKPTLTRRVLARKMTEGEAVALAGALAARLNLD